MTKMLTSAVFLFLQLAVSAQDEAQVLDALVREFLNNTESKEMHDRFWADDLTYTSSSGTRFGKAFIMAGFEKNAESESSPKYHAEDMEIKLFDDIAIVAFKLISNSNDGGQKSYLNSGTFQKRAGQWKAVNWQATRIPE
jgi:hypothetical protein